MAKVAQVPEKPPELERLAVFAAPGVFVVLWASGFIGAKFGLPYVEPMTFLFIRMAAVVALIGLIIAVTRPSWPDGARLGHSAVTGIFVHGCYLGGVFVSLHHKLPAGLAALVVSLQPVLTSTLANRLLGERVLPRQWAGLALGIAGVYLVVRGHTEGESTATAWVAITVALLGMTVGTLYQKRFGGNIDWRPSFLAQYAAAAALFGLGALGFETRAVEWTAELLFALAWLIFVLSFGAIWLLYFLIARNAATRVVSLFYLTPPITALMAWAMFDERLTLLALAGMAVCVFGVALVNWRAG
ncbi:MAG TPA: DMT family transporter [Xanthobacteraceae bacterium]|nr:DMT family transporter [Xanthobacteraceae bacterium]